MKNKYCLLLLPFFLLACQEKDLSEAVYNKGINIIPVPGELTLQRGNFIIDGQTKFVVSHDSLCSVAAFYANKMRRSTGFPISVETDGDKNVIRLEINDSMNESDEAYHLMVSEDGARVVASTLKGLFYGMASFMQLLPAEIESETLVANCSWKVPAVDIKDAPRFKYRGLMLDVARHFISVEGMKKHIDMLSIFKINRLHLHLTDYQGWRVEIKKYPKLTEIGSRRIDEYGKEYSGFYTQDDIRELVKYAQERFITIIPEVDVPGHSLAAVAAYPELSCTGEQFDVMSRWGRFPVVFCPGKEEMFEMLDGIFAELSELFPSEYFHIGGDECPKEVWKTCPNCQKRIRTERLFGDVKYTAEHKLQSYAIARCQDILHKYGKKMIGWDEILEGGLDPDATVMSWRGEKGGIASALMNHNVIMTPNNAGMYLDFYQGDPQAELFAWGAFAPINKTYAYNPVPDTLVKMGKEKYVLGVQANAWTECMYSEDIVEYRVYPRILAVAEVGWSSTDRKDFADFSRRLANAAVRMDMHDINYHIPMPEQPGGSMNHIAFTDTVSVAFKTSRPMKMVYTLDGSEPDAKSAVYLFPLSFSESAEIRIRSVMPSGKMSPVRVVEIEKQDYQEAKNVFPKHDGLKLKFAQKRCLYAKELDDVKEWKDSTLTAIEPIVKLRTNKYGNVEFYVAIANGYVYIPKDDIYEFRSNNTRVWVGDYLVVDNDDKPQVNSKYGKSLALKQGWHPIKIEQISNFIGGWNSQQRNNGAVSIRGYSDNTWKSISGTQLKF